MKIWTRLFSPLSGQLLAFRPGYATIVVFNQNVRF